MDYSTFNTKNFFIKKNSTLPDLKYPLIQQIREQYDLTDDMFENCAVTFSMIDAETGLYRIANAAGHLFINNDRAKYPDEELYTLVYRFTEAQTSKSGRYLGEFVIDFLNPLYGCGKIKLPTNSQINIIIFDSITKTTII